MYLKGHVKTPETNECQFIEYNILKQTKRVRQNYYRSNFHQPIHLHRKTSVN